MDTVYLETSIISYLRQKPGTQVVLAARQLLTHQWWNALHIATVAHHRIQYLLTWNCRHIANARILPRIHDVLNDLLIPIPVICTPEEMVGNDSEIDDN